ncbi:uncharacterized protein Tco025E_09476, partial [Trypanosoma conorhini]
MKKQWLENLNHTPGTQEHFFTKQKKHSHITILTARLAQCRHRRGTSQPQPASSSALARQREVSRISGSRSGQRYHARRELSNAFGTATDYISRDDKAFARN